MILLRLHLSVALPLVPLGTAIPTAAMGSTWTSWSSVSSVKLAARLAPPLPTARSASMAPSLTTAPANPVGMAVLNASQKDL